MYKRKNKTIIIIIIIKGLFITKSYVNLAYIDYQESNCDYLVVKQ